MYHFSGKKRHQKVRVHITLIFWLSLEYQYLFGESFSGAQAVCRLARGKSQVKSNESAAGGPESNIPSLSESLIYFIRLVQIIEEFFILNKPKRFPDKETVRTKRKLIFTPINFLTLQRAWQLEIHLIKASKYKIIIIIIIGI